MSESFDKLKELIASQKTLSNEDVEKIVKEHGELTGEEKIWLESEKLRHAKEKGGEVTMEQYLEACKVLDTAEESSDEYKKAEALVEKYEAGM